jgi:anti-sigma28 factor (negative regulator of flagellin synthesis)
VAKLKKKIQEGTYEDKEKAYRKILADKKLYFYMQKAFI